LIFLSSPALLEEYCAVRLRPKVVGPHGHPVLKLRIFDSSA